jgi:hypothetical protein
VGFLRRRRDDGADPGGPGPAGGTGHADDTAADQRRLRERIAAGWNGLAWGATPADFRARFPAGGPEGNDWWRTGLGQEAFCGVAVLTQYAFNQRGRLYLVTFIPEAIDRQRLGAGAITHLGPPDGTTTRWTIGDVELDVKVGGIIATMTHKRLADT